MTDVESDRISAFASTNFELGEEAPFDHNGQADTSRNRLLFVARAEAARRRDRRELLGEFGILSDPAWDILLELYISDATGSQIYASLIGSETGIPQSTALRWLAVLEKSGLVRRRIDVFDKRRQWVGLTPRARTILQKHFSRSR